MKNRLAVANMHCAVCGSKEKLSELYKENFDYMALNGKVFSARRTPDHMHYRFVRCLRCGLIFSSPILSIKEINSLYKKSSFTYHIESDFVKETYFKFLLTHANDIRLEDARILDVGCGNGFFLQKLLDNGIRNVYGIEPGISSVKLAPMSLKRRIKIDVLRSGVFRPNSFDIVCCFHTLDHVVDPNRFIQITRKLLRPGGKALFIVHDTEGLSVKLFGGKSAIFDIEHIYLFNKNNLAQIFKKNGFSFEQTFDIENNYPLRYWTRMVPMPFFLKSLIVNLLEATRIGRAPISLKAGNIGIAATK